MHSATLHSIINSKATKHLRSRFDTSKHPAKQTHKAVAYNQHDLYAGNPRGPLYEVTQSGEQLHLLLQLDKIAQERNAITNRLQQLNHEEAKLLSKLTGTVLPPTEKPVVDEKFQDNAQPNKMRIAPAASANKKPSRNLSAPADSTPSSSKKRNRSKTVRRVPLADKTEELQATFDSTSIFIKQESHDDEVSVKIEKIVKEKSLPPSPTKSKMPKGATKTTRVPMKFGDEVTRQQASQAKSQERGRAVTPRKEVLEVDGKKVEQATAVETPSAPKDYEVPYTVKRKNWDF